MRVALINTANFKVDGGAMFGVVPKSLWRRAYPEMGDNLIPLAIRSLVVATSSRLIVVDTGLGDAPDGKIIRYLQPFGGEGLAQGLRRMGYTPADVTDVVHTHLHFDHCGGSVTPDGAGGYRLAFPNARYHVGRAQWESAMRPNPREADSYAAQQLLAMQPALRLVGRDETLAPGVELRLFHGHTKGQIVPLVTPSGGATLVFAADLIPTSAHIPLLWNMSFDVEPLVTMREKEALLLEAVAKNYLLIYQHDYHTECSTLRRTPRGVRLGERLSLTEGQARR